jgi:hypothetical protein
MLSIKTSGRVKPQTEIIKLENYNAFDDLSGNYNALDGLDGNYNVLSASRRNFR